MAGSNAPVAVSERAHAIRESRSATRCCRSPGHGLPRPALPGIFVPEHRRVRRSVVLRAHDAGADVFARAPAVRFSRPTIVTDVFYSPRIPYLPVEHRG